jgi:hypothetical protein
MLSLLIKGMPDESGNIPCVSEDLELREKWVGIALSISVFLGNEGRLLMSSPSILRDDVSR